MSPPTTTTAREVSWRDGATLGRGKSRPTSCRLHDLVNALTRQSKLRRDLLEARATAGEPFHDQTVTIRVTRATGRKRSPCPRREARKFGHLLRREVSHALTVTNVGDPRAKFHVAEVGRFDVITGDA